MALPATSTRCFSFIAKSGVAITKWARPAVLFTKPNAHTWRVSLDFTLHSQTHVGGVGGKKTRSEQINFQIEYMTL
jgi:hypothetical protein